MVSGQQTRAHSVLFGSRKKVQLPDQLLFCHKNKVQLILEARLILKSRPTDLRPGLDQLRPGNKSGGLVSRISQDSRINLTMLLWQKSS